MKKKKQQTPTQKELKKRQDVIIPSSVFGIFVATQQGYATTGGPFVRSWKNAANIVAYRVRLSRAK